MSDEAPSSISLPDSERVQVERGGMTSLRPAAQAVISEAKSTRLQISLLLLFAMLGAVYWAGRDATRGISEAEVKAIVAAQDSRLSEVTKSLEALAELQKASHGEASRERAQIREMVHANVLETQLVKSHVSQR